MECEVRYYGMLGEKLGISGEKILIESDLIRPDNLEISFIHRFPLLKLMTFKVAVDGVITNEIKGSEVKTIALLPPFAGG